MVGRQAYHKLVRDRIPDIIQAAGKTCAVETLSQDDFEAALRAKLVEESTEASAASADQLVTELADIYEVIDALMALHQIPPEVVLAEQARRREARGGFAKRLQLLWTDEP
jgi:predicted house-cleaning noncanonical NTP pyrophosphatase (MazG superfamily)